MTASPFSSVPGKAPAQPAAGGARPVAGPPKAVPALIWLCRLAALACLFFGVTYWMKLLGLEEQFLPRFDLMPVHWQIPVAALAVLYPVAGIGLWLITSWGPVIWVIAAGTEALMHGLYPELYGERWPLLAAHGAVAVIYAGLRLAIFVERRRSRA